MNSTQRCQTRCSSVRLPLALLALLLAACGGKPSKTIEKGSAAAAMTYPVRDILVRWDLPPAAPQPGKKSPPPPPRKTYGRTKEQALERAKEAAAKARAAPDAFERVAKEMTDDEIAAGDGGFVGFVSLEAGYLKALVEEAAASPVGQVMDPLEGEGGWHVMQVLSREDGKRLESSLTAVVEGILVPWHEISLSLDPLITRDAAYAKAAQVLTALRAGESAGQLTGTIDGGSPFQGAMRRATRPGFQGVAAAALKLKADGTEWSDPVATPNGWAIVRRLPYLRARVRQVAIAFAQSPQKPGADTKGAAEDPKRRTAQDALKIAEKAHDRLKADPASWNAVVKEFSDEPESKDRGGLIGDVTNSDPAGPQTLEEIKAAVSLLTPGVVSPPIKSRIGFHLLRRDD
jgi:hypothetical protein